MATVAIDSNVLIYFFDRASEFQDKAEHLLLTGYKQNTLIVSELAFLELLAKPSFDSNEARQLSDETNNLPLRIKAIKTEVLLQAAGLRRQHQSLKTPDAIHLASALVAGASQFITNDRKLLNCKIKGLEIVPLGSV